MMIEFHKQIILIKFIKYQIKRLFCLKSEKFYFSKEKIQNKLQFYVLNLIGYLFLSDLFFNCFNCLYFF